MLKQTQSSKYLKHKNNTLTIIWNKAAISKQNYFPLHVTVLWMTYRLGPIGRNDVIGYQVNWPSDTILPWIDKERDLQK